MPPLELLLQCNGSVILPVQDAPFPPALPRKCAKLQNFPEGYRVVFSAFIGMNGYEWVSVGMYTYAGVCMGIYGNL